MLKTVTICRSVYPLRFILLLGILFSFNVFAKQSGEEYIIERENWKAFIRLSDGTVDRYEFREHGVWKTIPFRHDRMAGPAWDGIMLAHDKKNPGSFIGEKDHILYNISYVPAQDHLSVKCSMTNTGSTPYAPKQSRLILGIDSEMHAYPQWDTKFFPTMLRCEKDFAWGYFMSPSRRRE